MKLFRLIRFTFYTVFLVLVGGGYYVYIQALSKPLENREQQLTIPPGVGTAWLAQHLENTGVIENKYILRAYIWLNERDLVIKAGEYTLFDVEDIPELVNKVRDGRVIQYSITLIEGHSFKQYLALLKSKQMLKDEINELSSAEIMRAVGSPGWHPEGQFAPQTYFFEKGASDLDVLKMAHQRQQQIVAAAWENRSETVQLQSPYELLIMASIIEKETGAAAERELISGVFNNRLRVGMKLQTDPTVIYGMGEAYDGNIRKRDLTTDTEYNTYTRYGLPPTPIAMPGEAAILAAANPAETEAIFFVGKGDGTHQFSTNLKDHNNAVIKYQLGGKPRKFSSYQPDSATATED